MQSFWKSVGAVVVGVTLGVAAPGRADDYYSASAGAEQSAGGERPPAASRTTLRGVGNGTGNVIRIDNGPGGSTTTLENSRNGVGNRVVIEDGEVVTDVRSPAPPRAADARFGAIQFFSVMHDGMLSWCPRTLAWYRYDEGQQRYVLAEWDF